jgi:hypothetical protein
LTHEAVQVHENNADIALLAVRPGQCLPEAVAEEQAIGLAGQRIVMGEPLNLLVLALV